MWRVTLKGLAAHRLRFVLTTIAVLLGVAFVAGTMVFTDTIRRSFDDLFAEVNRGTDAVVRGTESFDVEFGFFEQRAAVDESLLEQVRSVDGVAEAEGSIQTYAQIVDENNDPVGDPGRGAPTFGFAWVDSAELNRYRIVEGRGPREAGEIAIDRGSAKEGGIDVGDTVGVLTAAPTSRYQVVGIVKFGNADRPLGASIVLFTPEEAQRVAAKPGKFDAIAVVAESGVSQEEVARRLRDALPPHEVEVVTGAELTEENQSEIRRQLDAFNTGLLVFAGVALLVGTFLIYNTFSIVVAQRTRELALLRAIGASQLQVRASVLGESITVGVFASALGVVAGIALAVGLKALLGAIGFSIASGAIVVRPFTVIVSLVVGTAVTVGSAVVPAFKASRVAPVEALRHVAIEQPAILARRLAVGGAISSAGVAVLCFGLFADPKNAVFYVGGGALGAFIGVFVLGPAVARPVSRVFGAPIARFKGITGQISRENAMRNPKRTSRTAAALMIGVALVGFITIFAASAKRSIDVTIDDQLEVDYVVTTGSNFASLLSPEIGRRIATLPEIEAATAFRFAQIQVDSKSNFAFAADPVATEVLADFNVTEGALRDVSDDGIAVSRRVANKEDWTIGDTAKITFGATGEQSFEIRAIYEHRQIPGDYFLSLSAFDRNSVEPLDFQVLAKLRDGVTPEEGRQAIEPLLDDYPTAKLRDQAQYKEEQKSQISQIVNVIYALLALAVLIAIIGIANTLTLSIHERTRELGLLRAVGMSRAQVRSAIRWESVLIALLGTTLGLVVGLVFGWVVVLSLRDEGFTEFAAAPGQLAIVVVIAGVAGVLAAVWPARRASRLDLLRAIATE